MLHRVCPGRDAKRLAGTVGEARRPEGTRGSSRSSVDCTSSETQPGERTRLVQPVSEPLRSGGRAHAQEGRLKSRIENELCQRQHKCRQTHHRLLHVEAEGEKNTQTARLAKPAKPPDRPGRSPTHSRAKTSRHVSAGAPEVVAAQRKSREHGPDADSGRRAATPVVRCAALRAMPAASATRETMQPAGASEGTAAR